MAVSSADADLATSESLKIAKEYDPEGNRTLAVWTKLDRMQNFEAGIDTLSGKSKLKIPAKLGIIGVINRKNDEPMKEQLEIESDFLQRNFPQGFRRHGIPYLEKSLSDFLMEHIRKCLPGVKNRISEKLEQYESVMLECGDEVLDKNRALSKVILKFLLI